MKKINRHICFLLVVYVALLKGYSQTYPIQLNTQLVPPFSGYVADYADAGSEGLKLLVYLNDFSTPSYDIKLKFKLEGQGITIQSKPQYYSLPFNLVPGQPLQLSGTDLADILNSNNLDFTGITKQYYTQHKALPEGYYTLCFTAYDANNPQAIKVSNESCAQGWLLLNNPPFLNTPACTSTLSITNPQNVVFNWTPMNMASPNSAATTEYEFSLYEIRPDGQAPNNILQTLPPIYTTTTNISTLNYGLTEPALINGMQYVWRVKAIDINGRDLFKNNGYSQPCTFTWGSAYDNLPALFIDAQALAPRSAKYTWDSIPQYTSYEIQYKKQNGNWNWVPVSTPKARTTVFDLEPDTDYEVKVQGTTSDGYTSPWSNTTTFRTPPTPIIQCGDVSPPPDNTNFSPLTHANPGMIWQVGQFELKVTQLQNTQSPTGTYSGKGNISIPFVGITLNTQFKNVTINANQQLVSGQVDALTDGTQQWLHDWDVNQAEDNATYVDGTIDSVYINQNTQPQQICYTLQNTSTPVCQPIDTTTNVTIIRDENGNQYTITTNPPSVSGPTNYFTTSNDSLDATNNLLIKFTQSPTQAYGFDKKTYAAYSNQYEIIQLTQNNQSSPTYFVPHKSIGENQTDEVLATIITTNNSPTSNLTITFKTKNGTLIAATQQNATTYKLSNIPSTAQCVYAYYNNQKVGKLNIIELKPITKDLVIIPVNNATLNSQTTQQLNAIYKQANVTWNTTTAQNFTFNLGTDNALEAADATLLSKYSDEMRALRDAYKQANPAYDQDAYYVFVVPQFSTTQLKGYMVRGRSLGFITPTTTAKDLAHELAHGAFGLEHTFPTLPQNTTTNLLDYTQGTQLTKEQWEEIRKPKLNPILSWDDSEEDGSYQTCNAATATLAYGVIQSKLNLCISTCSTSTCLNRDKLSFYVNNVCAEALVKLTNDERYSVLKCISDGYNTTINNLHWTEEEPILRLLRTLPQSVANCEFLLQKLEGNNFELLQKLRSGFDGDNYNEFIALVTQITERARPYIANQPVSIEDNIFKWNGPNGGINFTIQFNSQGLLSAVLKTNTYLGLKNVTFSPLSYIGILSKVKLPGVKNGYNGKYYVAIVPAIYLQWLYDKGESENAIKLTFAAASVLTLQGGVSTAINSANTLTKVFGILEAISGISSLSLDNSPIESAIVTKYGTSGQTFIDNVRVCLNAYNLASGTVQLVKLTTSYTNAKTFWTQKKTQIKTDNVIPQAEYNQLDNLLNETKLLANGAFGKNAITGINGFSDNVVSLVSEQGINLNTFKNIEELSVADLLQSQNLTKINAIRNKIPAPNSNTLMQKVIPKSDIQKYTSGQYKSCKGFMSTANDSKHLVTYEDIYYGMRLDYQGSAFSLSDGSCGIIRFKAPNSNTAIIPRSSNNIIAGVDDAPFPYTGHGFTSGTNGRLGTPEWKMNSFADIQNGEAELYEVFSDGTEILRATYNKQLGKFSIVQ